MAVDAANSVVDARWRTQPLELEGGAAALGDNYRLSGRQSSLDQTPPRLDGGGGGGGDWGGSETGACALAIPYHK